MSYSSLRAAFEESQVNQLEPWVTRSGEGPFEVKVNRATFCDHTDAFLRVSLVEVRRFQDPFEAIEFANTKNDEEFAALNFSTHSEVPRVTPTHDDIPF